MILSRTLCRVVRWRGVDDWRAIYGITYSMEGVGKRGTLKAKSLNTMLHIYRHKETTHTNTHANSGSGLGGDYGSIAVKQAETDQCYTS